MQNDADDIEVFLEDVEARVADEAYNFDVCPTRVDRNGPYHKQDVVAALLSSEGILSGAATLLGRQRVRLRDYIYRNADVLLWFDDMKEGRIDVVEHNVMKAAMMGDMGAGRFILTTLGKDRGYSTRLEQTGKDGVPLLPPSLDFKSLSLEALKELKGLGVKV